MELLETIVKRKHSTKAARDRRSICFLSCFPFHSGQQTSIYRARLTKVPAPVAATAEAPAPATTETAAQPKPSPTKAPAIKPVMPGGRKKSKNNKKKKKGNKKK